MTLITKTTLFYLVLTLVVFGVGGVLTYQSVKKAVERETDYSLNQAFRLLVQSVEEGKPIDALSNDKVSIQVLNRPGLEETKPVFTDTLATHPYWQRLEPHRKMTRIKEINGVFYEFSLMDVFIESDDMYRGVVGVLSRLFFSLCLVLLLLGLLFSRWLFKPFKTTLERLGSLTIKSDGPLDLPQTTTLEFRQLNDFIERMVEKNRRDYLNLKEFTENASHEMQTPLAVAEGKLELLLQSPELSAEQLGLLQEVKQSIGKLSKMGHALTLLMKIENQEFSTGRVTDLTAVMNTNLSHFQELAELKGLRVNKKLQNGIRVPMDPMLADILVGNLLRNAIQHNEVGGWIEVELTTRELVIANPGAAPDRPTSRFFERFQKGNRGGGSLGLGLAIVKKICEAANCTIRYEYAGGVHRITLAFPENGVPEASAKNQNYFRIQSNSK